MTTQIAQINCSMARISKLSNNAINEPLNKNYNKVIDTILGIKNGGQTLTKLLPIKIEHQPVPFALDHLKEFQKKLINHRNVSYEPLNALITTMINNEKEKSTRVNNIKKNLSQDESLSAKSKTLTHSFQPLASLHAFAKKILIKIKTWFTQSPFPPATIKTENNRNESDA